MVTQVKMPNFIKLKKLHMNIDIYKNIDNAVFKGIKRTINRFRENPFYYFTEADIHSSLYRDILDGNSDIFYQKRGSDKIRVSLVHQEYPTFFRYKKEFLKKFSEKSFYYDDNLEKTTPVSKHGDRGNYDLTVLDPAVFNNENINLKEFLKEIINKDLKTESYNKVKPLYFIEVKFLHLFNYTNKQMLNEISMDNEKLSLAFYHYYNKYHDSNLRCINLVFCSAEDKPNTNIIKNIRNSLGEGINEKSKIAAIFVQSFLKDDDSKSTPKPFCNNNAPEWAKEQFPP